MCSRGAAVGQRGKTPQKVDAGVRLITAKNVRMGYLELQPAEFISAAEYASWMTRGFPRVGDLLFTPEAPLGNVAVIDIEEKFALAQRAICFQLHVPAMARYLRLLIMSLYFQQQLIENATGTTASGIKASKLKEIPIPIPCLEEQERMISTVDRLLNVCRQLRVALGDSQRTQLLLADAITEQAVS